jgi:hypothetical protein
MENHQNGVVLTEAKISQKKADSSGPPTVPVKVRRFRLR